MYIYIEIKFTSFIERPTYKRKHMNRIAFKIKFTVDLKINRYNKMSSSHHHLVVPSARISLTFSRHPSLSLIASSRSLICHKNQHL